MRIAKYLELNVVSAAGYSAVKYGPAAALTSTNYLAYVLPRIVNGVSAVGSWVTKRVSWLSIDLGLSKLYASSYVQGPIAQAAAYGRRFTALSNVSPIYGAIAILQISLLANTLNLFLASRALQDRPKMRMFVSHLGAGAAVWQLSALVVKAGLASTSLSFAGAATLSVVAYAAHRIWANILIYTKRGDDVYKSEVMAALENMLAGITRKDFRESYINRVGHLTVLCREDEI